MADAQRQPDHRRGRVLAVNCGSYNWVLDARVENPVRPRNTGYDVFDASLRVDVLFRDDFEARA